MALRSPFPSRVVKQLDGSVWAPYNCWVATIRGLIAFASGGLVHVDAETVRKRADKWIDNPSRDDLERLGPSHSMRDISKVLRHPDTVSEFQAVGLRPPKVRYLGMARGATVRTYLARGYQVAVTILYSVVNQQRPSSSGQPSFGGLHSVRWYGDFDLQGNPQTTTHAPFATDQLDPLCDGRRRGIAKGPQRIPLHLMMAETAPVAGVRRVYAVVVAPARRLVDKPDDTPADDCASLEAENERLQGVIRSIASALVDAQAPLNQISEIVKDPANTGGVDQ